MHIIKHKTKLIFTITLVLASLCAEAAHKIVTYFDIGSAGTKYTTYSLDSEKGTYITLFDDYVPVHYALDLENSQDNRFSEAVIVKGIQAIETIKAYMEAKYGHNGAIEYYGVATASWRKAFNGDDLRDRVYNKTGVPIRIISQKEEAELGYEGIATHVKQDNVVVWDIGGGSMQIVTKGDQNSFITAESSLATQNFTYKVREEIKRTSRHHSPHPMTMREIDQAITLAKLNLGFEPNDESRIKEVIATDGGIVYGISPIHERTAARTLEALNGRACTAFSQEELKQAIMQLAGKGDEAMSRYSADRPNPEFVKSHLTDLILIYATMEKMGIETVIVSSISIIDGLIARGPEFVTSGYKARVSK